MSLKEAFAKAVSETKFKPVTITADSGTITVYVRTLTGPERQEYDVKMVKVRKGKDPQFQFGKQKGLLVSMTLIAAEPPTTALMFSSAEEFLNTIKDSSVLDKVYEETALLNGIMDKDDDEGND
jgi:hypothetical protein